LCEADMAALARQRGGAYYYDTIHNFPAGLDAYFKSVPHECDRRTVIGRTLLEGKTIHVPDILADPEYYFTPARAEVQQKTGFRTVVGVPLLRDGKPIGVIVLMRTSVRPFTEKQIELLTTFADQAVIAIENVRLFDEVQVRTRDLTEALEQQTATSEVLEVISSSPGELEPVFKAMLAKATQLCKASNGNMFLWEGGAFRTAALHGDLPPAYLARWPIGAVFRPGPHVPIARVAQ